MDDERYWMWTFNRIELLRWMLKHKKMPIRPASVRVAKNTAKGDKAILYVARSAYRNPQRDVGRLGGLVTVSGDPQPPPDGDDVLIIDGLDYALTIPIKVDVLLPDFEGPPVSPYVASLSFIDDPTHWGTAFRFTPRELTKRDFRLLAGAIARVEKELG